MVQRASPRFRRKAEGCSDAAYSKRGRGNSPRSFDEIMSTATSKGIAVKMKTGFLVPSGAQTHTYTLIATNRYDSDRWDSSRESSAGSDTVEPYAVIDGGTSMRQETGRSPDLPPPVVQPAIPLS